jgi:hypothetical protein
MCILTFQSVTVPHTHNYQKERSTIAVLEAAVTAVERLAAGIEELGETVLLACLLVRPKTAAAAAED